MSELKFVNRLGIDYGSRRWGISFSDELGIATPLDAIVDSDLISRWDRLDQYVNARRVAEFVVGYPINMDGSVGFKAREVDEFIEKLAARYPDRKISRVDERLTSEAASSGWTEKKKRQERKSGRLDSRAAALILQDYLDQTSLYSSDYPNADDET